MVLKVGFNLLSASALGLGTLMLMPSVCLAQGSPVPGQNNGYTPASNSYSQGQTSYSSSPSYPQAPVPGAAANPYLQNSQASGGAAKPQGTGKGAYSKLPLNVDDAKVRIAEMRTLLAVSRPQDVQEGVFQLCEWLSDMADAHWKLSLALAKNDSMKAAAAQERQSAVKFSSLKHEAGLLKAELFIKQNRLPEALGPLVDIVVAEPKSIIGQAAYEKLKEIGFAEEPGAAGYQLEKTADKSAQEAPELKVVGRELKTVGQELKPVSPTFKPVSSTLRAVAPLKTVSPPTKPASVQAAYSKTARAAQSTKTR